MKNDWLSHITFVNGLPRVGKSLMIYRIVEEDHGHDLVLNLRKHHTIDRIRYTVNYVKARNRKPIQATRIPKYSAYARVRFLKLFRYEHPDIKHVLIDEVERYHLKRMLNLLKAIQHFEPQVPIMLFGIIKDSHNQIFKTSQFLLKNCHRLNINPSCQFCERQSVDMLNIWHHHKITYDEIDAIGNRFDKKRVKHEMKRYHVCKHHYLNPPQGV